MAPTTLTTFTKGYSTAPTTSWKLDNSTVPNGPNPRPTLAQSPPDDGKEEMRLLTGVEMKEINEV
jgi:hypothetical protein